MYYTTPIYQFRMKCTMCDNHYVIKTDPKNLDYEIVSGARRQERRWDSTQNGQVVPDLKETTNRLFDDAMFKLEHGDADKEKKFGVESRISDTFQTLGEVSIENENYPQAIDDLQECLARRKRLMPEDSRLIAETHYQLGVAQGFNIEFDNAVDSLNGAIHVLQKRIDNLKNKTESVGKLKFSPVNYNAFDIKESMGSRFCGFERLFYQLSIGTNS